jgi:hypothetical protein
MSGKNDLSVKAQVKMKLSLCSCTTIWRYVGGMEMKLNTFFILTLDGGEWSASHSTALSLDKVSGFHWIWICGSKAGLDVTMKKKISHPPPPTHTHTHTLWCKHTQRLSLRGKMDKWKCQCYKLYLHSPLFICQPIFSQKYFLCYPPRWRFTMISL